MNDQPRYLRYALFYPGHKMHCGNCGYDGHDGWNDNQVGEEPDGDPIVAWFCPLCDAVMCIVGDDCPPDEFGQS